MNSSFPYKIDDTGIHSLRSGQNEVLAWREVYGLKKSLFSSQHAIYGKNTKFSFTENQNFVEQFFRTWQKFFPDAAKKNAFDYAYPNKVFAKILLVTCLIVSLPLGFILLRDSREHLTCTNTLQKGAVATQASITKARKKRKGHFILSLRFSAASGEIIDGQDQFITTDASNPPNFIPVIYAKENPHCWTTPVSTDSSEINWAKRRYFTAYTALFGSFAILAGIFGIVFSVLRLREKRFYAKILIQIFSLK